MRFHGVMASLLLVALTAGCLDDIFNGDGIRKPDQPTIDVTAQGLVAHRSGLLLAAPAWTKNWSATSTPVGRSGTEPTIGVDGEGRIFVAGGGGHVWTPDAKGKRWSETGRVREEGDADSYLWLDQSTDRIFSGVLPAYTCMDLDVSTDAGRTWKQNPRAGCGTPGQDHPSLVTGPPPVGVSTNGYPNVLYYTFASSAGGTKLIPNFDGGASWVIGPIGDSDVFDNDCQGGMAGRAAVDANGFVYIPKPTCFGLTVGTSEDAGRTWRYASINGEGMSGGNDPALFATTPYAPNPGIAVDDDGAVFAAWTGRSGLLYLARSTDHGKAFSKPLLLTPPSVNGTVFSALVSGASGQVAVAYFGTESPKDHLPSRLAHDAKPATRWHVYVSIVNDSSQAAPVVVTWRLTPPEDPTQIGCIWQAGGINECRNLKDYIDMTERDGRLYIAYADGCDRCIDNVGSRRSDLFVATLELDGMFPGRAAPRPAAGQDEAGAFNIQRR